MGFDSQNGEDDVNVESDDNQVVDEISLPKETKND